MLKANEIMTKSVSTIQSDKTLLDATNILIAEGISGIPVVDEKEILVGIITEKDILNFVFSDNLKEIKIEDVMTKGVISFSPDDHVDSIAIIIGQSRFRRVPIIVDGKVIGIISRRDIIKTALDNP